MEETLIDQYFNHKFLTVEEDEDSSHFFYNHQNIKHLHIASITKYGYLILEKSIQNLEHSDLMIKLLNEKSSKISDEINIRLLSESDREKYYIDTQGKCVIQNSSNN